MLNFLRRYVTFNYRLKGVGILSSANAPQHRLSFKQRSMMWPLMSARVCSKHHDCLEVVLSDRAYSSYYFQERPLEICHLQTLSKFSRRWHTLPRERRFAQPHAIARANGISIEYRRTHFPQSICPTGPRSPTPPSTVFVSLQGPSLQCGWSGSRATDHSVHSHKLGGGFHVWSEY